MAKPKGRRPNQSVSEFSYARAKPNYGSKFDLPRAQERVPRSTRDSLMEEVSSRLLVPSAPLAGSSVQRYQRRILAKRRLRLQVARQRLAAAPRTSRFSSGRARQFLFKGGFSSRYNPLHRLKMAHPKRVLFCLKRKVRREVLFAFRKAGFGGSAKKKHWKRTQNSQYSC